MGKTVGADLPRGLLTQAAWVLASMASRGSRGGGASGIIPPLAVEYMRSNSEVRSPQPHARRPPGSAHRSRVTSRVYAALWKNSVAREMSFKSNFLLWILVELLWFALQLSFISVLFCTRTHRHLDQMAGRPADRREPFHPADFSGLFPDQLHPPLGIDPHGQAGFPAAAAGQHALRRLAAAGGSGRVRQCGFAVAVMVYAARQAAPAADAAQVLAFSCSASSGIAIHYSLMFLLAAISFWTVRARASCGAITICSTSPGCRTRRFAACSRRCSRLRFRCCWCQRARPAAGQQTEPPTPLLLLLGMCVVCALVSEWGWRISISRYTSASS